MKRMGNGSFGILLVVFLAAFFFTSSTWAKDAGPIKIGFIAPLSGPLAQLGKDAENGAKLYLEEIGHKMAGRKVEMIIGDTEGMAAKSLSKTKKAVEMDKVDIILGPISGVSGAAILPYINSRGVPTVFPVYALDDLTQRERSEWIVRTAWTSSQTSYPFAEYCYNVLGYRKVAFFGSDYQFTYELVGGFQRVFEGLGGTCLQRLYAPYTCLDFNPYIPQLDRKADAIYLMWAGKQIMQFLKQYQAAGLKGRIQLIGTGVVTDENSLPRMGDEALGIITSLHYSTALQNPENLEFQRKFKKLAGKISGYYGESYYTGAKWFHTAVEALKGDLRDKKKLMEALRNVKITCPRGPMKLDAYGSPIQNVYIRKVERVKGELQNTVIKTYENVSQFWKWKPEEYLKEPMYSRNFPPLGHYKKK